MPGDLLNQFSLSEHDGALRAATTEDSGATTQSHVTVLETRGGRLEKIGQVSGLGQGERIYAVRFIEDRGYVVTFRQTDPLYTLDLADPAHPRVRGELKILGYSSYLHPVGEHELLGIGQDATAEGIRQGTQLSLFDVADPAARSCCKGHAGRVQLLRRRVRPPRVPVVGAHAARGRADLRLLARRTGARRPSASTSTASRASPRPVARARTCAVLRTLVVGGRLFTLTEEGLRAHDLGTLAARAVRALLSRAASSAAGLRCRPHEPFTQTLHARGRDLRRAGALRGAVDGHRRRLRRRGGRVPLGLRGRHRPGASSARARWSRPTTC